MNAVGRFINEYSRGILFFDELDKISPSGSAVRNTHWALSVFSEFLTLLDADERLIHFDWLPEDIKKFRDDFFVIGGGAWQHCASSKIEEYVANFNNDDSVPPEILLRFNPKLIHISRPTVDDFKAVVIRMRRELGIGVLPEEELNAVLDLAVNSHKGMRWLETYLLDLYIIHPEALARLRQERAKQEAGKAKISSAEERKEKKRELRLLIEMAPAQVTALHRCLKLVESDTLGWSNRIEAKTGLLHHLEKILPALDFIRCERATEQAKVAAPIDIHLPAAINHMSAILRDHFDVLRKNKIIEAFASLFSLLDEIDTLRKELFS